MYPRLKRGLGLRVFGSKGQVFQVLALGSGPYKTRLMALGTSMSPRRHPNERSPSWLFLSVGFRVQGVGAGAGARRILKALDASRNFAEGRGGASKSCLGTPKSETPKSRRIKNEAPKHP